MKDKINIHMVGYMLVLCFSLTLVWLFQWRGMLSMECVIILLLTGGFIGLVRKKAWSSRFLVLTGFVGSVYALIRLLTPPVLGSQMPWVILAALSVTMMAFYHLPVVGDVASRFGLYPWTILVVDDDRALVKLLETNFRRYGIFVLTAETGERGLTLADKYRPDLIILDVILPKMKGRAVCAKLKEDPRTKDIPVIFLTAKNSMDDVQAEMAAGAHAHITKPVDFKDLFSQVKKILNK